MLSPEVLTSTLVGIITFAIVYIHFKIFSYWSSRNIKGPLPVPIFGTNIYYLIWKKIDCDLHWRKKYGKVFGLYDGYSPMLHVTDRELIKFIYIEQFKSFTKRNNTFVHDPQQKEWMLWTAGGNWAKQRALISPMFSNSRMRGLAPQFSNCISRFLDDVNSRLISSGAGNQASNNSSGKSFDEVEDNLIQKRSSLTINRRDIMSMTVYVSAANLFGIKVEVCRERVNELIEKALDFSRIHFGRFIVWILMPRQIARLLSFDLVKYSKFEYFDMLIKSIIRTRRKKMEQSNSTGHYKDLIQMFLDAKLPENNDLIENSVNSRYASDPGNSFQVASENSAKLSRNFTDLEIRGQMTFVFLAGFETSAITINSSLIELSHNEEVQEELYSELVACFGLDFLKVVGFPEEKYSDLMNLPLLDAFVSEVLRLYPPAMDNTRCATERVLLPIRSNPIWLPVGMPISTNSFVVQRDPDYFENPDTFDLSRFSSKNKAKVQSGSHMPFGLGPRYCAGMRFALMTVKMALCKIILSYRVLPKSQQYPPKFQRHMVFLLHENSDFELSPRA